MIYTICISSSNQVGGGGGDGGGISLYTYTYTYTCTCILEVGRKFSKNAYTCSRKCFHLLCASPSVFLETNVVS